MNEIYHFINDITIKDVILLLLGTVLGFLTNIVSSALYPKMQIRYKRWLQQRWARGHTQLESSLFTSDKPVIVEQMINVIILARGHFGSEEIQCSYLLFIIMILQLFESILSLFNKYITSSPLLR